MPVITRVLFIRVEYGDDFKDAKINFSEYWCLSQRKSARDEELDDRVS
jgi:hypothetical protein